MNLLIALILNVDFKLNLVLAKKHTPYSHRGMLFTSKNTVSLHIQAFQFEQEEVTAKLEPLCLRSVVFRDHTHRQPHHRKPQTWTQFQLLIKICLLKLCSQSKSRRKHQSCSCPSITEHTVLFTSANKKTLCKFLSWIRCMMLRYNDLWRHRLYEETCCRHCSGVALAHSPTQTGFKSWRSRGPCYNSP